MLKIITKLVFILFVFTAHILSSQTIKGKITDADHNPVAYANIQIAKTGLLSNEEGDFSTEINHFKPTDSVKISYLGLKNIKMTVADFVSKDYILAEEINELSEVLLSKKKLSLDEILINIKEHLSSNYSSTYTKQQIFKRNTISSTFKRFEFEFTKSTLLNKKQRKKVNQSIDSLVATNINKTSTNFSESLSELYTAKDSSKIKMIKSIELVNKKDDKSQTALSKLLLKTIVKQLDKEATYKVKSGFFTVEDSLKMDTDVSKDIYPDSSKTKYLKKTLDHIIRDYSFKNKSPFDFVLDMKKYHYELQGVTKYDNETVYIINFKPKKSSAKFVGTMYVNSFDFAIVKLDFKYGKGKSGYSANLKLVLGVKFKEHTWKGAALYQKNIFDKYQLKFIKQTRGSYVYMKRPFKFKKNKAHQSEGKKIIKMNILMEQNGYDKTELFFITNDEISNDSFNSIHQNKKYKNIYVPKYSPNIWKGYNVLSPINDITNYDTGK